jgi:predicted nucleic acid-binding Zn ribbon protein
MRQILDVRCTKCNEITEVFGRRDDSFRCGACDSEAKRIISPVKCQLEGVSGHFPDAAARWEREHNAAGRKNRG